MPQPAEGVTYAHKIEKGEAPLDWTLPAAVIERRVRAFDPFPGVQFALGPAPGTEPLTVKLWQAEVVDGRGRPGEVLSVGPGGWVVACGERALSLKVLQKPGGRRLGVRDFLAATPVSAGQCLAD